MATEKWKIWTARDARQSIVIPSVDDDKYSRGVLGIITGSEKYPGAAVLTCQAAMRTGIGMVRYCGPSSVKDLVLASRPEVVTAQGQVNAWLLGSGIDSNDLGYFRSRKLRSAIGEGLPVILDAGAIIRARKINGPTLITPHYRELQRLLSERGISVTASAIEGAPKKWASYAAEEFGVTVLLKGNVSVVSSKERQIQLPASTSWLATAGTGDVLSGIIGALVATQTVEIEKNPEKLVAIAATGAYIHSRAAAIAIKSGPIVAMDVVRFISKAISEIL